MANSRCTTYNEFISDALTQENHNNLHAAAKGRKRAAEAGTLGSSQSRAPVAARPQFQPPAPKFRPPPPKAQTNRPQEVFCKAFTIALPKGNLGQGSSAGPKSNQPCFNYNQVDHWFKECSHPKKNNNQNQSNQRQANPKACPGYVHYTTVEEVPTGEVVTAGMFLVNKHPTIILFDSGASHSFMSQAFVSRHD